MKVRIAIDDFGTGYSSLSYLRRFSVDTIKIDRSFVQELRGTTDSESLVKAIIDLARTIGSDVVAEGIETGSQFSALRRMDCAFGQGYRFARPLPADQVTVLLASSKGSLAIQDGEDDRSPATPLAAAIGQGVEETVRAKAKGPRRPEALDVRQIVGLDNINDIAGEIDVFHTDLATPITGRLRWARAWSEVHATFEPAAFVVHGSSDHAIHALALLGSRRTEGRVEVVGLGDGAVSGAIPLARDQRSARMLARAINQHLRGLTLPWELRLSQIPEDDLVVALLEGKLPNASVKSELPVPRLLLSDNRSLADRLSPNMQRQLRRARGRLETDGRTNSIDIVRGATAVKQLLPTLTEIHLGRDRLARQESDLDDPTARRFWRRVILDHAATDHIEIATLTIDATIAAYVVALVDGASYRVFDGHFNSTFARYSAGRLLEAAVVERALADGSIDVLDWMSGVAPEKILAADGSEPRRQLSASSTPAALVGAQRAPTSTAG